MIRVALASVVLAAACGPEAPVSFHIKCPPDPPWRPARYVGNTAHTPWNDRDWSAT